MTYTSLLYGNGPGFKNPLRTENLTDKITSYFLTFFFISNVSFANNILVDKNYVQESAVYLTDETHGKEFFFFVFEKIIFLSWIKGGEDVSIYAKGPLSYLFDGYKILKSKLYALKNFKFVNLEHLNKVISLM